MTDHNFKEAKRVNEMIKQLLHEIEILKNEVEQLENILDKHKRKIRAKKKDYGSVKNNVIQAKENYGIVHIRYSRFSLCDKLRLPQQPKKPH